MHLLAWLSGPLVALTLGVLSLLHVYWAFGGRFAWISALPEVDRRPLFVPTPVQSFGVAAGLALAALILAAAAGLVELPLPPLFLRIGCYAIAATFALRAIGEFRHVGFFKRNRGTRFARMDSLVYSPLCVAIAAGAYWVGRRIAG